MPRFFIVIASFATLVLGVSGCGKPEVGAKCKAGQLACLDAKSGLFCGADSTFKAMTCGGPGGCEAKGSEITCNNDVAASGDGCSAANDNACTADKKTLLQCKNEAFAVVDTCKGVGGCKIEGGKHTCDSDLADVGDPCSATGSFACVIDKSAGLRCDAGKYTTVQSCRGPKGCAIAHSKPDASDLDCDFTVAAENDPCTFPDNEACTADKKSMLTCKDGKYGAPTPCSSDCTVTVTGKVAKANCEGTVASAGGVAASGGGGGPWSGTYHCGTQVVQLTQNGNTVSGTTHQGIFTDVLTCTITGNKCEGSYFEKVANSKPSKNPSRSGVNLSRYPDGRIGLSYPIQPTRATTCSK